MIDKRVLFICNYFAPDSTIAAVRTTKLVKYMRQAGVSVDFLAAKNEALAVDEILERESVDVQVEYAYNSRRYKWIEKSINKTIDPLKQRRLSDMSNRERVNPKTGHVEFYPFETAYPILGSVGYILNNYKQKDLFKNVKEWLKSAGAYDYVISSYGDAFCYYAGMYYHKKHPETKWIFDIRDAVYRYKFIPQFVKPVALFMEQSIWREADYITGISKGICARVPKRYRGKVHKITNGYDISDREGLRIKPISDSKLIMTFTGSMYGGLQKLTPLFLAIKELTKNGLININEIEIHYAGTVSASKVFRSQLNEAGIETVMVDHGKLSRKETLELQNGSDILLTPSYDYERNKGGILTGKFFEYMSAHHPLIVIVTGDIENSEIAEITRKCQIGIAYEQSHHDQDYEALKKYVLKALEEKKEKGKLDYSPNYKEVKKYDYRYITKKFMKAINLSGGVKE